MKDMVDYRKQQRAVKRELEKYLTGNARRRARLDREVETVRGELRDLLVEGRDAGLSVTWLAETAQISRVTAHKLLGES